MTHTLKTWPEFYESVLLGDKNFEVRKFDRPFKVNDAIILQEWDNHKKEYTGREMTKYISYILHGNKEFGIYSDYCVIGLRDQNSFYIK